MQELKDEAQEQKESAQVMASVTLGGSGLSTEEKNQIEKERKDMEKERKRMESDRQTFDGEMSKFAEERKKWLDEINEQQSDADVQAKVRQLSMS